ncbi:MAG: radical SAM protein [Thermodesulfobacteriota bacterium]|nr:radical SAM protein [Thermodesulfobacteriota bacterium]
MAVEKAAGLCTLRDQGFHLGSCTVSVAGKNALACQATLRKKNSNFERLISAVHLSRPENYLSIYQSGCNFSCRKCHSWHFSKHAEGEWYTPEKILQACLQYEKKVTWEEPRSKATAYHAHDTCRCCGACALYHERSPLCPGILDKSAITLSPQGFGPVRNIVGFTGGDLTCRAEFYARCSELIKAHTKLWVLIETNGYGLSPKNLDLLREAGVDAFWLDIKAYKDDVHRWLTGCSNEWILQLPEEMARRNFTLEVLSLFIPGVVEADQLEAIAKGLVRVDEAIPFTILAFFPEYKMKDHRSPTLTEMVTAFAAVKTTGLKNVRLGNTGIFAKKEEEIQILLEKVGRGSF